MSQDILPDSIFSLQKLANADDTKLLGDASSQLILDKFVSKGDEEYYYLLLGEFDPSVTNYSPDSLDPEPFVKDNLYSANIISVKCSIKKAPKSKDYNSSATSSTLIIFVDRDISFDTSDLSDFDKVFIMDKTSLFLDNNTGQIMFHESARIHDGFDHFVKFHKVIAHDIFVKCNSFSLRGGEADSISVICGFGESVRIDGASAEEKDHILKLRKLYVKALSTSYKFSFKNISFLDNIKGSPNGSVQGLNPFVFDVPDSQPISNIELFEKNINSSNPASASQVLFENISGISLNIPQKLGIVKLAPSKEFDGAVDINASQLSLMPIDQGENSPNQTFKFKVKHLTIQPFIMPRGKFEVDTGIWINFKLNEATRFTSREFIIKILGTPEDVVYIPKGFDSVSIGEVIKSRVDGSSVEYMQRAVDTVFEFDRIVIDTSVQLRFYSKLIAHEEMEVSNATSMEFANLIVGSAEAGEGMFTYQGSGDLHLPGNTNIGRFDIVGPITVFLSGNSLISCIIGSNGASIIAQDIFKSNLIRLNTEIERGNLPREDFFGLKINSNPISPSANPKDISIGQLEGKISRLVVSAPAEFCSIKIDPISDESTILTIDPGTRGRVNIGEFIATCKLAFDRETGQISIVMDSSRSISGGAIDARFAGTHIERYLLLNAGNKINLGGKVEAAGIAVISDSGNVNVSGTMDAPKILVAASKGSVHANTLVAGSASEASSIMAYAAQNIIVSNSHFMSGADLVLYNLAGKLLIAGSRADLGSGNLTAISESGDLMMFGSSITGSGGRINVGSGGNMMIEGSHFVDSKSVVRSIKDLVMQNTTIEAKSIAVISEIDGEINDGFTSRIGIAPSIRAGITGSEYFVDPRDRGEIVSIFSEDSDRSLSRMIFTKIASSKIFNIREVLSPVSSEESGTLHISSGGDTIIVGSNMKAWKDLAVKVAGNLDISSSMDSSGGVSKGKLDARRIFIDADNGFILGADIKADDYVGIKIKGSLQVMPALLYNELLLAGGFTERGVKIVASKIQAGILDIEAGKVANFMEAILKGTDARISADYVNFFKKEETIAHIKIQQDRMRELTNWFPDVRLSNVSDSGREFAGIELDFSNVTEIEARKGGSYTSAKYKSNEVHLTQDEGDITFDASNHFNKLYVDAKRGSVLFTKELPASSSSSSSGNVLRANELFVECSSCHINDTDIVASGSVKIIAKDSVYMMPVSVFKSWIDADTAVSDEEVKTSYMPSIRANLLQVSAGKFIDMISAKIDSDKAYLESDGLFVSDSKLYTNQMQVTNNHTDISGSYLAGGVSNFDVSRTAYVKDTKFSGGKTQISSDYALLSGVESSQDAFAVEGRSGISAKDSDIKDGTTQFKSGAGMNISNGSNIRSRVIDMEAEGKIHVEGNSVVHGDKGHIRTRELILIDSISDNEKGAKASNKASGGRVEFKFDSAAYIDVDHNLDIRRDFGGKENLHLRQRHGDIELDEDFHVSRDHFQLDLDNGDLVLKAKRGSEVVKEKRSDSFWEMFLGISKSEITKEAEGITLSGDGDIVINVKNFTSNGGKLLCKGYAKINAKGDIKIIPIKIEKTVKSFSGNLKEHHIKHIVGEINAGNIALNAGGSVELVGTLCKAANIDISAVKGVELKSAKDIFEKQVITEGARRFWLFGDLDKTTEHTYDSTHQKTSLDVTGNISVHVEKGDFKTEGLEVKEGAESFSFHVEEGNVVMKDVKDLHIYDKHEVKHHILSLNSDGDLSFMGSKTVEQHFFKEKPNPTILSIGKGFYGYSGGKLVMLDHDIQADKIELRARGDITLEAVDGYESSFTKIDESGFRIKFDLENPKAEASVQAGLYNKSMQEKKEAVKHSLGAFRSNELVIQSGGTLKTKGHNLESTKSHIEAKNWLDEAVINKSSSDVESFESFSGLKAGYEIGAMKMIDKSLSLGKKIESMNERGDPLNLGNVVTVASDAYGICRQAYKVASSAIPIKFGVNAKVSYDQEATNSKSEEVVGSKHDLGDALIRIEDKWCVESADIRASNMDAKAKEFEAVALASKEEQLSTSLNINLEIPLDVLTGNVSKIITGGLGPEMSAGASSLDVSAKKYVGGSINVAGKLKLDVKDGKVVGTSIDADIVDINASSMLVASVQDTLKSSSSGFNISVDPTNLFGENPEIMNVFSGIYAEGGSGKSQILSNIGSIVGRSATSVIVSDTLKMAGGLIANAALDKDGELTAKGEAQVKAGNLIIEKLADFDEGMTLGLGLTMGADGTKEMSQGIRSPFGNEYRAKMSLKDRNRDISSALLNVQVTVDGELIGAENLVTDSQHVAPEMKGTDFDMDVTFVAVDFEQMEKNKQEQRRQKEEYGKLVELGIAISSGDIEQGLLDPAIDFMKEMLDSAVKYLSGLSGENTEKDTEKTDTTNQEESSQDIAVSFKDCLLDKKAAIKCILHQERESKGQASTEEISAVEDFYITNILTEALKKVDGEMRAKPREFLVFLNDVGSENVRALNLKYVQGNLPLSFLSIGFNTSGMLIDYGVEHIDHLAAKHATELKVGVDVMARIGYDVASKIIKASTQVDRAVFGDEFVDSVSNWISTKATIISAGIEENTTPGQRAPLLFMGGYGAGKAAGAAVDAAVSAWVEHNAFKLPNFSYVGDEHLQKLMHKQHYYKSGVKFDAAHGYASEINLHKHNIETVARKVMPDDPVAAQKFRDMFSQGASGELKLKDEVVARSGPIENLKIKDPRVIDYLTSDGSHKDSWQKRKTPNIETDKFNYRVHFYQNMETGKIISDAEIHGLKLKIEASSKHNKELKKLKGK